METRASQEEWRLLNGPLLPVRALALSQPDSSGSEASLILTFQDLQHGQREAEGLLQRGPQ